MSDHLKNVFENIQQNINSLKKLEKDTQKILAAELRKENPYVYAEYAVPSDDWHMKHIRSYSKYEGMRFSYTADNVLWNTYWKQISSNDVGDEDMIKYIK